MIMKIRILCPARELADSAHLPTSPCYRNRFPYGRLLSGGTSFGGRGLSLDRIQVTI